MSQLAWTDSQPEYWEELDCLCVGLRSRGFKSRASRSRMSREAHVRFCEGLSRYLRFVAGCSKKTSGAKARAIAERVAVLKDA